MTIDGDEHNMRKSGKPALQYRRLMGQRQYLKMILANMINRFGDSVDSIAFTWLVYAITGSASWSAVVFALNRLPSICVQPFAGVFVEGMRKKTLMVAADLLRFGLVGVLAVLYILQLLSPVVLLVLTLLISSVEAFRLPAGTAILPMILDKECYEEGMSLNQGVCTLVELIGLGLAGVVIATLRVEGAILIDAATFLLSGLIIAWIRVEEEITKEEKRSGLDVREYLHKLREGARYAIDRRAVLHFCLLAMLINALLAPVSALLTPLVVEVFQQDSQLLSAINLSLSLGMGVGSLVFPLLSTHSRPNHLIPCFLLITGLSLTSMTAGGLFPERVMAVYAVTCASSFLIGGGIGVLQCTLSVEFMKAVEERYLARTAAIFNACGSLASPVASLASGALAGWCSVGGIIAATGALCACVSLGIWAGRVQFESEDRSAVPEEQA